jgi:soluble lytic murein transglycosylase-like protein
MIAIFVFFFLFNQSLANTYVYHQQDGSTLLTDKKVNKKGYILKKVYQNKSKYAKYTPPKIKKKSATLRIGCKSLSAHKIQQRTRPYLSHIQKYAQHYQVDAHLIRAIIRQESCFKIRAKSPVGAMGLMQLMPNTAKELGVKNAWNPEQNIAGGVKYISQQLKRFKGDKRLALAAYNAGPGAVLKYKGIPPYRETKHYVINIMAEYQRLKKYRYPKKLASSSQRTKLSSDFSVFWGRK